MLCYYVISISSGCFTKKSIITPLLDVTRKNDSDIFDVNIFNKRLISE